MLRTLVLGTVVAVGLMLSGQGIAQAGGPGYYGGHHHHHHHSFGYSGAFVGGRQVVARPVFVGNSGPAYGYPYGYGYGGGYGQPYCGSGYGGYGYGYPSYGVGVAAPGFGFYYSR